jgi:hypothetical protein
MNIEENRLSDALHDATANVSVGPDFLERVHRRGARRLLRHRAGAAVAAVAVVAAIVPTTMTLAGSGSAQRLSPAGPSAGNHGGSVGGSSTSPGCLLQRHQPDRNDAAVAEQYPKLLLLPPGQQVSSATVHAYCPGDGPRVSASDPALAMYRTEGQRITRGIVVTAMSSRAHSGIVDGGKVSSSATPEPSTPDGARRQRVHGRPGSVSTHLDIAQAEWREPDGTWWHAQGKGFDNGSLVSLLNKLQIDRATETASLPHAARAGWTVVGRHAHRGGAYGAFTADWSAYGHQIQLMVTQGPDETGLAAAVQRNERFVTVHGHRGVLSVTSQAAILDWHTGDAMVELWVVNGGTGAQAQRIAESLAQVSPHDPRIGTHSDGPPATSRPSS